MPANTVTRYRCAICDEQIRVIGTVRWHPASDGYLGGTDVFVTCSERCREELPGAPSGRLFTRTN